MAEGTAAKSLNLLEQSIAILMCDLLS
jgi:hypothetical protein